MIVTNLVNTISLKCFFTPPDVISTFYIKLLNSEMREQIKIGVKMYRIACCCCFRCQQPKLCETNPILYVFHDLFQNF